MVRGTAVHGGAGTRGPGRCGHGRASGWSIRGPRSTDPSGRSTWPGRRSGITAAERAGDPDGFETEYELRHGRPLRRVPEMPAADAGADRRSASRASAPAGRSVDLDTLTEFEQAVLRKTMEIPYGEVRPYSWVAREIGRPRAVRAVGTALAGNPITFVIPCHRVVRADGHIGNYGAGGPEAKREVLELEGIDTGELERMAGRGVRYTGSTATNIYCYPSCRHARRTIAAARGPLPQRRGGPGCRLPAVQGLPAAGGQRPSRPRPATPGRQPRPSRHGRHQRPAHLEGLGRQRRPVARRARTQQLRSACGIEGIEALAVVVAPP